MNKITSIKLVNLTTTLKDYQTEDIKTLAERERKYNGGFLLSEAGVGKSIEILALIIRTHSSVKKSLIVCPSQLIMNWVNEIKVHTDDPFYQRDQDRGAYAFNESGSN